jgi:hypothetical protein
MESVLIFAAGAVAGYLTAAFVRRYLRWRARQRRLQYRLGRV